MHAKGQNLRSGRERGSELRRESGRRARRTERASDRARKAHDRGREELRAHGPGSEGVSLGEGAARERGSELREGGTERGSEGRSEERARRERARERGGSEGQASKRAGERGPRRSDSEEGRSRTRSLSECIYPVKRERGGRERGSWLRGEGAGIGRTGRR
jgi:hypothetical protein